MKAKVVKKKDGSGKNWKVYVQGENYWHPYQSFTTEEKAVCFIVNMGWELT